MDSSPFLLDRDARSSRNYRYAVERHRDPADVDLEADARALEAADPAVLSGLYVPPAKFGAGERAAAEDLSPLGHVLEPVEDQLFLATQLYEEAKHTGFFDRYRREVIHPAEWAHGLDATAPTADRWFDDAFDELFERTATAMHRLPTDDTPENRTRAYCHSPDRRGRPRSDGPLRPVCGLRRRPRRRPRAGCLVEGLRLTRQDEGRHVGFGLAKLKRLVHEDAVDPALVEDATDDLLALVAETVRPPGDGTAGEADLVHDPDELATDALEKHADRLAQITDADRSIPGVETLTSLGR